MTNEVKMQKLIAAYTPLSYQQINLSEVIKDKYVAAEFKSHFCHDICAVWKNMNATSLHNEMFVTLKTGEDILKILTYII